MTLNAACLATFVLVALLDYLWALYMTAAGEGRRFAAASWAAALYVVGAGATLAFINHPVAIAFAALGSFAGTYFGVKRK